MFCGSVAPQQLNLSTFGWNPLQQNSCLCAVCIVI